MKMFCSFLLIVCLCCGAGFPLYSQGNPNRLVLAEPLHIKELQNKIKPLYSTGIQDSLKVQKKRDSHSWEESRDTVESLDSKGLQNKGYPQEQIETQNRNSASDSTIFQNISRELQNGEESQEKTKIKLVANQLIIENLPADGILEIYNIMGVKVYNRHIKAGNTQHYLSLSKGYYIVKIDKFTRKISVK